MTLFLLFLTVTNSSLPPRECYYCGFSGPDYPLRSLLLESPAMSEQCSAHHIGQAQSTGRSHPRMDFQRKRRDGPAKR